jgi:hypothetical protein
MFGQQLGPAAIRDNDYDIFQRTRRREIAVDGMPDELTVEQPSTLNLSMSLRNALGLPLPLWLLARPDEVIE